MSTHCSITENMKSSTLIIPLVVAGLCGCYSLPQKYSASPTRSLVRGVSADGTSVQIRSVDGSDANRINWLGPNHPGDKVWLEPGVHKVNVVCSTEDNNKGGSYVVDADVEVDVQPGYTYSLTASPFKGAGIPHVTVTKRESKG
jgi:hypothetical protein